MGYKIKINSCQPGRRTCKILNYIQRKKDINIKNAQIHVNRDLESLKKMGEPCPIHHHQPSAIHHP